MEMRMGVKSRYGLVAAAVAVCGMCLTASAEDGYIESHGDAYVSLGHCAGPNTKMEVDFQLPKPRLNTRRLAQSLKYVEAEKDTNEQI